MENEPDPLASGPRRVEAYLDHILAPLARSLSSFHQDELRRELREHLWAHIEAYGELDYTENEAVTEALRQFGGAEDFLHQWRREWEKTPQKATMREVWRAALSALRPSLSGVAIAFLPCIVFQACYSNLQGSAVGALLYHYGDTIYKAWILFAFLLMPALIGIREGRRLPTRAGARMLAVLTAEIAAASLLYELAGWVLPGAAWGWPAWLSIQDNSGILFTMIAVWIPVAASAAALSDWWLRRSKTRHLA